MKIIKILLFAFGGIILIVLLAFVAAGLLIPAEQSFTNEIEINAPAEKFWKVALDKSRYTEWLPNLSRVEVISEEHWIEHLKDSPEPLKFFLVSDERPSKMEIHYKMHDSFDGHWKGEVAPTANGIKLKTIDSYAAKGWLTKILIYAFFDLDEFAKDCNDRLKRRVEQMQ